MSKDRGDYIWSPAPGSRLIEAVAWPKASTPLRLYPFKASFTKSQQIGLAREQFSAVWLSVDLTPKITVGRRRFHLLFKPIVSQPYALNGWGDDSICYWLINLYMNGQEVSSDDTLDY